MIVPISAADAKRFVSAHHYSGTCAAGVARYGWEVDGELVGVTVFDNGIHAMRQGVFGEEHYRRVLHHHRLAIRPDMPTNTASQFIGASLKHLKRDRDVLAVVTYADLCQGHNGTIYRATNAVFTGIQAKGNLKFRTTDGELRTTQGLSGTWPQRRAEAASRGWTEVRCKGKARYVYLLGRRRALPPLLWPIVSTPDEWRAV